MGRLRKTMKDLRIPALQAKNRIPETPKNEAGVLTFNCSILFDFVCR
jgi:hypothetical protein